MTDPASLTNHEGTNTQPLWGYRVTRQGDPGDFLTWHWFSTVPVRDGQIMAARAEAVAEAAQALDSTDASERVIIEWVQLGNTVCQMCGRALTDVDVKMVDMFSVLCLDCERVLAAAEGEAERREEEAATAFHNGYGFLIQ